MVLQVAVRDIGQLTDLCGQEAGSLRARRRIFAGKKLLLAGLAIFGAASAARVCGARSPDMLIAARAALGVGGALMLPVLFEDRAARAPFPSFYPLRR